MELASETLSFAGNLLRHYINDLVPLTLFHLLTDYQRAGSFPEPQIIKLLSCFHGTNEITHVQL